MVSRPAFEEQVAATAASISAAVYERAPTLGGGRFVCVDGPAASGKSTLGRALARSARQRGSVRLVRIDDMLEGWTGLAGVSARVDRDLVAPLALGGAGRYRRYDWQRERLAEWRTVEPVDLLVLEGVGSGASRYADHITTLVWVEAPQDVRLARGVERDGEAVLPQWLAWMDDEQAEFAREDTRARADVLVDGALS